MSFLIILEPTFWTFFDLCVSHFWAAAPAQVLSLEKIRTHVEYERAIMAVRFSDEFVGTQYHPELSAADVGGYLSREIFQQHRHLGPDLLAADFDPEAEARLGAPKGALLLDARARELINWLDHVEARKTA